MNARSVSIAALVAVALAQAAAAAETTKAPEGVKPPESAKATEAVKAVEPVKAADTAKPTAPAATAGKDAVQPRDLPTAPFVFDNKGNLVTRIGDEVFYVGSRHKVTTVPLDGARLCFPALGKDKEHGEKDKEHASKDKDDNCFVIVGGSEKALIAINPTCVSPYYKCCTGLYTCGCCLPKTAPLP
jgi:hypothetical protein